MAAKRRMKPTAPRRRRLHESAGCLAVATRNPGTPTSLGWPARRRIGDVSKKGRVPPTCGHAAASDACDRRQTEASPAFVENVLGAAGADAGDAGPRHVTRHQVANAARGFDMDPRRGKAAISLRSSSVAPVPYPVEVFTQSALTAPHISQSRILCHRTSDSSRI